MFNTIIHNSAKKSTEKYSLSSIASEVESYNEMSRQSEAFTADLSQYTAKEQRIVQKAIDSGILNNTNRSHELVDLIAKLSAHLDTDFDFVNNEKLKESGFAIEGVSVNGFVNENGITINTQSQKYLNSVVGHEITHVLKGSELFDSLQSTLFDYAKSRGEYDTRLERLTEAYKGIENVDINEELTADLVGDYIFTDRKFVEHLLNTDRNAFQKIYDEVKYLCKIATAGSKEAKALLKAKKIFDDVYSKRETSAVEGVKYSLKAIETNGTEHVINPFSITKKDVLDYLTKSKKGQFKEKTYFPISSHTPKAIINTLQNAGINVADKPLIMQAKKAKQSTGEKNTLTAKDGTIIRYHAVSPEEILEVVDKLVNPEIAIYQTNRTKKVTVDGQTKIVPTPDNFAFFVTLDNGKECVAIIEFDSFIEKDFIIEDDNGESFHTTVTIFEPDVTRNGEEFDYAEYLLMNYNNHELDIVKESPNSKTAYGENHATVLENELSNIIISNSGTNVNRKNSLSPITPEIASNGTLKITSDNVTLKAPEVKANTKTKNALGDDIPIRDDIRKLSLEDIAPPVKGTGSKINYQNYTEEDFESNSKALVSMKSVKDLTGNEFSNKDVPLRERIRSFFASLGNKVKTEEFGEVALNNSSLHDDFGHGLTFNKVVSFDAIPEVLNSGVVIDSQTRGNGNYERIIVAAPITIANEPCYMGVMLQRDFQSQRLYLHDVVTLKQIEALNLSETTPITTEVSEKSNSLYMTSILQKAVLVNSKSTHDSKNIFSTEQKNKKFSTRAELHDNIIERIKSRFSKRGYDFDEILSKAKDLQIYTLISLIFFLLSKQNCINKTEAKKRSIVRNEKQ